MSLTDSEKLSPRPSNIPLGAAVQDPDALRERHAVLGIMFRAAFLGNRWCKPLHCDPNRRRRMAAKKDR